MLASSYSSPHFFSGKLSLNYNQLIIIQKLYVEVSLHSPGWFICVNLFDLLPYGIFVAVCLSNESKISVAEHSSSFLVWCTSEGSPLFPVIVLYCFSSSQQTYEFVRCEYTQFLQVVSFFQVTKVYLSVKVRFSSQAWFQQIPIIFLLYHSPSAEGFEPSSFVLIVSSKALHFLGVPKWKWRVRKKQKHSAKYFSPNPLPNLCIVGRF